MYTNRHMQAGPPVHEPMLLSPRSNASSSATPNPWSHYQQSLMGVTAAGGKKAKNQPGPPSEANDWSVGPSSGYGPMPGALVKTKRLLTLAFDDKEAVWSLPATFTEVEEIARNWLQPPDGVKVHFRIPAEYASVQASRLVHGPYLWIPNDETYQIAIDRMHVIRIEIVSDSPPPPDTPPSPPPPPPVFEMPCEFDLELAPGQRVALGTICNSEDLDMSRSEDGTLVDGNFWGCLKIVHTDDEHSMEFSGTRIAPSPSSDSQVSLPSFPTTMDHRTVERLALASRPSTVKCVIRINTPKEDNVEVGVCFSPMWNLTSSFPPAERVEEKKAKWFVKVRPGGIIEHYGTSAAVSELFYEAIPDTSVMALSKFVTPSNSYALPLQEFMVHLTKVLDSLGLSLNSRSAFLSTNFPAFSVYRNIAYRFMPPKAINRAIELFCTHSQVDWTRIFFMWRGVSEDELVAFASVGKGDKEAHAKDWRPVVEWKAADADAFSVLEVSAIECT